MSVTENGLDGVSMKSTLLSQMSAMTFGSNMITNGGVNGLIDTYCLLSTNLVDDFAVSLVGGSTSR